MFSILVGMSKKKSSEFIFIFITYAKVYKKWVIQDTDYSPLLEYSAEYNIC